MKVEQIRTSGVGGVGGGVASGVGVLRGEDSIIFALEPYTKPSKQYGLIEV